MDSRRLYADLSHQQQLYAILSSAIVLRLVTFALTPIPRALQQRPELSTPLTSFRSLNEGVYLYRSGNDPYDGGVFHHSPIYLAFFTYIIPVSSYTVTALFWTISDMMSAMALVRIWQARSKAPGRSPLVAALFLYNPYTLVSCLARSTTSLDNMMLLLSVSAAAAGDTSSGAFLAATVHSSLYPIMLLPPIMMLAKIQRYHLVFVFATVFGVIWGTRFIVLGTGWMDSTWGVILTISDLTPNVGMWWYFFTEMFDHFRSFFLGVFQLHNLIYVAPVCIRLRHDPLMAILILMGIFGTWKSYPTLGDTAVWAGLLGCFPEIIPNLRHPLFSLTVHLYTIILLPLLHSLWLLTGTGNANFFYAATMVYGLNACLTVVDVLGAALRTDVKRRILQFGKNPWKDWSVVQMSGVDA